MAKPGQGGQDLGKRLRPAVVDLSDVVHDVEICMKGFEVGQS